MTPASVLRWALRAALPSPLDWLADLVGELVEDVPPLVREARHGWTSATEVAVYRLAHDALDEVPGIDEGQAHLLAEAVVELVRLAHDDCAELAERRRQRRKQRRLTP
jgi:hypothetical protein